jgi:HEAT repeat protein
MSPSLHRFAVALVAAGMTAVGAWGQAPAVPGTRGAPGIHESTEETISRCLRDLESTDAATRRRAVMVLGKYEIPQAQFAVIAAFQDPDAEVRRHALVSIAEHLQVPVTAKGAVVALLDDPSLEIRRIASAALRDVLLSGGFAVPSAAQQDHEFAGPINRALADDDPVVRKNVLGLYPFLRTVIRPQSLAPLMQDDDVEVRALAVRAASQILPREELAQALDACSRDPDPRIRLEVVRAALRTAAESLPLLEHMSRDPDVHVRFEAAYTLLRIGAGEGRHDLLDRVLGDEELDEARKARVVATMTDGRDETLERLQGLCRAPAAEMRAAAIQALAATPPRNRPSPGFFLELAADPASSVRAAVASALQTHPESLEPRQLQALSRSPHPELRLAALRLAAKAATPGQNQELLLNAILDDDTGVRSEALRLACTIEMPGWERIAGQSMRDPEPEIVRTGVQTLINRNTPACRTILSDQLEQHRIPPELEPRVRARLRTKPTLDRAPQ